MIRPRLRTFGGWGMAHHAHSWSYRPPDADGVLEALEDARSRGLTVVHRGAGCSYGDAALNEGGATLLTDRLDRILAFDPHEGRVRAQAGVTIERLWKEVLPHGWWPAVVPGTMQVTLGGAVAMNVHGKNQHDTGSIGEHVTALTVARRGGRLAHLDAGDHADAFRRCIGTQGLMGTLTEVTLQLRRVASGLLEVLAWSAPSLTAAIEALEEHASRWEYAVGWIDCLSRGRAAGRGLLHFARHLPPDHGRAGIALSVQGQAIPSRLFGVVPRRSVGTALSFATNDPGAGLVNVGRYGSGRLRHGHRALQTLARFHFLLDAIPSWRDAYRPHGLLQYQLFVPGPNAAEILAEALRLQRRLGVFAYLGVLKKHRGDAFPASYSVDGYSLALDFPIRPDRLAALGRLCREYDELLRSCGGRLFAAKDAVGVGHLPPNADPLFSSNLVRRWARGAVGAGVLPATEEAETPDDCGGLPCRRS